MDVALLYFDDCPNHQHAEENLAAALIESGAGEVVIRRQRVGTVEEAERFGFLGSPTILIDGVDPFAAPGASPGLSCRVYRTEDGPAGAPTVAQIRQALATHTPAGLRAPTRRGP